MSVLDYLQLQEQRKCDEAVVFSSLSKINIIAGGHVIVMSISLNLFRIPKEDPSGRSIILELDEFQRIKVT